MLHHVASILNLPPPKEDVYIDGVSIDSRTLQQHNLFVAIRGDNFDGHAFLEAAKAQGAAAALVDRPSETPVLPELVVDDTRLALGQLAKGVLVEKSAKRVAITGSVGKTTVKEMVAAILQKQCAVEQRMADDAVIATIGNLNNDYGVPLTVFRVADETAYGVFELGANHVGEIAYTADIVRPHVALVNNVAGVHLEGFGSLEGVATGKSEIYQYLTPNDTAIVNADDAFAPRWQVQTAELGCHVLRYGIAASANDVDVFATELELTATQTRFVLNYPARDVRMPIQLALLGEHSCRNALAAASIAFALGVSAEVIAEGLAQVGVVKGRFNVLKHASGATLIDDTYNANGKSIMAAIDVVQQLKTQDTQQLPKTIALLGYLGELGDSEAQICAQITEHAATHAIDALWVVGTQAPFYQAALEQANEALAKSGDATVMFRAFDDIQQAADALQKELALTNGAAIVLVKGSRSAAMERVFTLLEMRAECATSSSVHAANKQSNNAQQNENRG